MIRGIAPLHAAFWGTRAGAARGPSAFLQPQRGVSWIDGLVRLYLSSADPPWFSRVWDGLCRWLAPLPVCVSHGDFRPGNCLFHNKVGDVIITDWEALAVTPFLWDFTYATVVGMTPATRRLAHRELLEFYLSELDTALRRAGNPAAADALPSIDVCESAITALSIVIFYFGWVLGKLGGIGGPQGNSDADCAAWQERGTTVLDRTSSPAQVKSVALALGVDSSVVLEMRQHLGRSQHPEIFSRK